MKLNWEQAIREHKLPIGMTLAEALEKQMPKQPTWDDKVPHGRCPVCNSIVAAFIDSPKPNYCYWCGQKLDWGVQNDRER